MSVKDFYNAVTPGSSLTHGVGRGVYTVLGKDDICSAKTFENEKVPTEAKKGPSLLNEVKLRKGIGNFILISDKEANWNMILFFRSKSKACLLIKIFVSFLISYQPPDGIWILVSIA